MSTLASFAVGIDLLPYPHNITEEDQIHITDLIRAEDYNLAIGLLKGKGLDPVNVELIREVRSWCDTVTNYYSSAKPKFNIIMIPNFICKGIFKCCCNNVKLSNYPQIEDTFKKYEDKVLTEDIFFGAIVLPEYKHAEDEHYGDPGDFEIYHERYIESNMGLK